MQNQTTVYHQLKAYMLDGHDANVAPWRSGPIIKKQDLKKRDLAAASAIMMSLPTI